MTTHDDLERRLRAAADRLLAGAPLRSSGKLTIVDLAAEAEVKRWILTHKRPDLMRAYQAEFRAVGNMSAPVKAAHDRVGELEDQLRCARADNRNLTERLHTYATVIDELAAQLDATTRARDQAVKERDAVLAKVTVLPSRSRMPAPS